MASSKKEWVLYQRDGYREVECIEGDTIEEIMEKMKLKTGGR